MSYTHLTAQDRYVIYHLRLFKLSYREIGRRLGRHYTTIMREVKRNGPIYGGVYWNLVAQQKAEARRRIPRHHRRRSCAPLYAYVMNRLQRDWAPEAIAGRLRLDFPEQPAMRMSAEGIYRWVYEEARDGGTLYRHLRRRHKRRRRQCRYGKGVRFAGRIGIAQRPPIVLERNRLGDWEADSVEGRKGTGAIATHVERRSRFLLAVKLADKKAKTFTKQSAHAFQNIPRRYRLTLTVDNGSEFSDFKRLETLTGFSVFFADPYAAWQRGTNENTNGLLRQYFPKGSDFNTITDKELAKVVRKLNNRPRKCLDYRTPAEVLRKAMAGALGT
jgi:IS30 family transposase